MMFDKYTKDKILSKDKDITRRLPAKNGRRPATPNATHKIKIDRTPKTYGHIKIISVRMEKLGDITESEAKREGFKSVREYLNYFKKVNKTDDLNTDIWRIEFKLMED